MIDLDEYGIAYEISEDGYGAPPIVLDERQLRDIATALKRRARRVRMTRKRRRGWA